MITCSQWIGAWINKGVDAVVLVVVEQLPTCFATLENGHDKTDTRCDYCCEIGPVYACKKHDATTSHNQKKRGAKVGLLNYQRCWQQDDGNGQQNPKGARFLFGRQPVIICCQKHNEGNFHQLGWLQAHESKVDPALCAFAFFPEEINGNQKYHCNAVAKPREVAPKPNWGHPNRNHQNQTNSKAFHLRFGPRGEAATCH